MDAGLIALWMSFGLIQVCECLQWVSSATLQDKVTIPACAGQDVTLAWDYTHTAEEHVMDVEWRYCDGNGTADTILATEINGNFVVDNFTEQAARLEYIPSAGIRLLNVSSEDNGTYSVHVNVNLHGSVINHVQTAEVIVADSPITVGDSSLQAHLQGATFLNTTQQHHLLLVCGNFDPLWTPRVSVLWTTPDNKTVPSTYEQNGQFVLAVPNPFISGEYTCKIDNSSEAARCIQSDSPLTRGATVLVVGVEGRMAIMDSEVKAMAMQIHTLEAEKKQMASEMNELSSQILDLNRGIRLVNGSDDYEGRVEMRVSGTWSTVCSSNWGNVETQVACKNLGLPTTNATWYTDAYFGEGTGAVSFVYNCHGWENYLLDCQSVPFDTAGCSHTEDVGVRCE